MKNEEINEEVHSISLPFLFLVSMKKILMNLYYRRNVLEWMKSIFLNKILDVQINLINLSSKFKIYLKHQMSKFNVLNKI